MSIQKIGFGGGCHWCTEAYFQALKGVEKVEQGWIKSIAPNDAFSEAVIVHYDPEIIPLPILVSIHLHTHSSTKTHQFREKYRSAVYVFDNSISQTQKLIEDCQSDFNDTIITQTLQFDEFKINVETQINYYNKNKAGAFCERYIHPKLQLLEIEYAAFFKQN